MLDLYRVTKTYRRGLDKIIALSEMSVRVQPGEFVAVQGPSGCGKTTLLLTAGGLLRPNSGRVLVAGQDVYELSEEARARFRAANIGFVFQQFHLVPYLTVLDNVLTPALARDLHAPRQRGEELLNQFGLWNRRQHVPGELSTGERQRTALARALMHRPKLVLADEPTGNLDVESGRLVLQYLRDYTGEESAVLLVTHDSGAAEYATRVVRFDVMTATIGITA